MITLPEDVLSTDASGGWDGVSVDSNTGFENPNKETSMDWAEHQRIVCEARKLLAGNIEISPSAVKKAFKELQSAYNDSNSRSVVKVSKGIHQPATNPHLQLRVVTTFRNQGETQEKLAKFHLDVSAVDTKELDGSFQWVGVQFSFKEGARYYKWPANASPVIKKSARRNSISFAKLDEHIQEVAAAAAAAEEKAKFEKICSTYGIDPKNISKLKKGQSVPGRDGAYQYGKSKANELTFQKTGTRGYLPI
jgi:hypothetical protein